MKLGYIGFDQYGQKYTIKNHPRKELLEELYATHVRVELVRRQYVQDLRILATGFDYKKRVQIARSKGILWNTMK